MDWRIYYDDGSTFSNEDGASTEAPTWGVQAIVLRDETVGRYILGQDNYYWFENGMWFGGDFVGLIDFLQRTGLVKFGRTISNQAFNEVWNRAASDPDFPRKSAFHKKEIRP